MPDPEPADTLAQKRNLIARLAELIRPGPRSKEDLLQAVAAAQVNAAIDAESRLMLEGVLRLVDMTAGDALVAAPRMKLLDLDAPYEDLLAKVISTAHSRFPVYQGERENIIGMLLAKDLLKLQRAPELNVRTLVRPAVFIPESKGLNDLLREFRATHNHLAIVVDEFGRIAGLITIEDVLEEIVGEIEDEFDIDTDEGEIFALSTGRWRVAGNTPVEDVNEYFEVELSVDPDSDIDTDFDTIGGLIAHQLGHVPVRGERVQLGGLEFMTLHTRGGAVRWFSVQRLVLPGG